LSRHLRVGYVPFVKHQVTYAVLTAVAIVGGLALARVGTPSAASANAEPVARTPDSDPEPSIVQSPPSAAPADTNDSGDGNGTKRDATTEHGGTGSIHDAVARIAGGPDVPTVLPDGLPQGFGLADRHPLYEPTNDGGANEWILHLARGQRETLLVSYGGRVNFDGCDVPSARRVSVSGTPGLLALSRQNGRVVWSQLIWPANHAHPVGRYGLSGSLPPSQLLEMARTMPRVQPSWLAPGAC
jgi:hypothetical protein